MTCRSLLRVCLADECVSVTSKYLHRVFPGRLASHTQPRTGLFPEGECLLASSKCARQHFRTRPVSNMAASQGAMCCESMRH